MLGLGLRGLGLGGMAGGFSPSHWLTFSGDDYVALPTKGCEPTADIFIEAWIRNFPANSGNQIKVIRGNTLHTEGYALYINVNSN